MPRIFLSLTVCRIYLVYFSAKPNWFILFCWLTKKILVVFLIQLLRRSLKHASYIFSFRFSGQRVIKMHVASNIRKDKSV